MSDPLVVPVDLRTGDSSGLVTCAEASPSLQWRLDAQRDGVLQLACEVERCADAAFGHGVETSGRIETAEPFGIALPGAPLASREVTWARVRVWTDQGLTAWSAPLRIEGGLFTADDWVARPISPDFNVDRADPAPVPLLRRSFGNAAKVISARLYVTAQGIWRCWINGKSVTPDLFEPGWTSYQERLAYSAYDVTDLVGNGENVLAAMVGDGWWRGNLTWIPRRAVYGATTAFMAQLEIVFEDGSRSTVCTDETWKGATGALLSADFYDGCQTDLNADKQGWREPGFDDSAWSAVVALPLPTGLVQRSAPPVREVMHFEASWTERKAGVHAIDCAQNLTGYLRLKVKASGQAQITVRHAEVLEADGALHTAPLRTAKATDTYLVGPGEHLLAPEFTFHGFRYAEVSIDGAADILGVEICVVSSDLKRIGRFSCSDERLNRLHENIVWSQRGNFISIPTDCPQRDERLGWTGDIQVFSPTACTLFDARAFLGSWMVDLAAEQAEDGQVTSVVPNVIQGHEYEFGGIGWADAATLVPWALYESYGDRTVLARQFGSMKAWVDWGASRLSSKGVWTGDFHLGDWLDPGAPPESPELATTDRDYIASCYLSRSARVVADTARLLGDEAQARQYDDLSARVAAATWNHWGDTAITTQTGCALALAFDIAPRQSRAAVGEALAALVRTSAGRIATGFLGTPVILPALTLAGQDEAAFTLLMNEQAPGWLYQVKHGATTMWERWDAIIDDGLIHRGEMAIEGADSMTSFNHYAYGSVGEWLYRRLAGLAPDIAAPGYRGIRFAPCPGGGVSQAEAEVATPFGDARIAWRVSGRSMAVELRVPAGAQAAFVPPAGWKAVVQGQSLAFGSGSHQFELQAAA